MYTRLKFILVFLFLVSGCYRPYHNPPKIIGNPQRIIGVAEILSQKETSEIDLLLIHGMCMHGKDWVAETNNNILNVLNFVEERVVAKDLTPTKIFTNTELYSLSFSKNGKTLRTHAIVWSPVTARYKKALCFDCKDNGCEDNKYCCDGTAPKYPYKRAYLNNKLKNILVNDCFSDALIYVGIAGEDIKRQVSEAVTYIAEKYFTINQNIKNAPIFIISESLGSKILFDVLIQMSKSKRKDIAIRTLRRTMQVFMGANQIPLLSLAAPPGEKEIGLDSFLKIIRDLKSIVPEKEIQIVSFTDPNDLLSYPLIGSEQAVDTKIQIVDVIVSNANTWIGLFENPLSAHTDYRKNEDIFKIIVCGFPHSVYCK